MHRFVLILVVLFLAACPVKTDTIHVESPAKPDNNEVIETCPSDGCTELSAETVKAD